MLWADRPELPGRISAAPRGRERRAAGRLLHALDGARQLADREDALEAGGDLAGAVDDERPRLRRQAPREHLRAVRLARVVVLVDLLLDEADALAALTAYLLGDVHDRPARARLAQRRRREQ